MKLPIQPNFHPHPGRGNALGPVVGTAITEEMIGKAFDVAVLAGMGRIASLSIGRARSLHGLGASTQESRLDLVSRAQSLLTAAGHPAQCREVLVTAGPLGNYYNRQCSVTCPSGRQTAEEFSADLIVESPIGVSVAEAEILAACRFLDAGQPVENIDQYMATYNPNIYSQTPAQTPAALPASTAAPTPTPAQSATVQPGNITVPPADNTGTILINGAANQQAQEQSNLAAMFGDNMGPIMLAGAAVVALIIFSGGKN